MAVLHETGSFTSNKVAVSLGLFPVGGTRDLFMQLFVVYIYLFYYIFVIRAIEDALL